LECNVRLSKRVLTAAIAVSTVALAAPAAMAPANAAKTVKVGLAYDIGGRGDKSFNDAAARGLDKAKKVLHVTTKEVSATAGGAASEREDKLRLLAQAGYNPIIAVGFLYGDSVKKVAAEFPKTTFGIIDDSSVAAKNVYSLVFAEEQGSYLAGVAAAKASKSGKIGYIGGVRIPLLQKFEAGFVAGVKATKKSATVDVKYVTEPPDFGGFNDPAKAKVIANGMIDAGTDVIYAAAGGSGKGLFEAAVDAAAAGNKVWTIGVDSDQYMTASAAEKKNMLTSMLKRVDVAVFDMIQNFVKGKKFTAVVGQGADINGAAGDAIGKRYNLKNNGVGLSASGGYLKKLKIDAAILSASAKIKTGTIKVPTVPAA
jgi:basic membrane protein A